MSAYSVATLPDGTRTWWENWQFPLATCGYSDIRPATVEEALLMEKVVWERDVDADRRHLRELIQRIR